MTEQEEAERRRQLRGLVWLALAALVLALLRAAMHGGLRNVFPAVR
jgi:hypothetical protein